MQFSTILVGDFHVNFNSDYGDSVLKFFQENWGLTMVNERSLSTTKNQTCVDAIFIRNVDNMKIMRFIS